MVLRLNSELGSSFLFPVLEVEEVRAPMGFIGFGGCGSRSRPPKAGKIMAQNQKKGHCYTYFRGPGICLLSFFCCLACDCLVFSGALQGGLRQAKELGYTLGFRV